MTSQVNRHFNKLTPLGYQYNSDQGSSGFAGTGFFYHSHYSQPILMDEDELPPFGPYLVTNKHIVEPIGSANPDKLAIYLRDGDHREDPKRYSIPLYDDQDNAVWLEHPKREVDVIMILLDHDLGPRFTYKKSQIPQTGNEISGGDLARIIGYPSSLPEFRRFPIMRSALISSPYGISLEEADFFYFDARLHNGMSGSPVVYIPPKLLPIEDANIYQTDDEGFQEVVEELSMGVESFDMPNTQQYLLGIHSDERTEAEDSIPYDEMQDRLEELETDSDSSILHNLETVIEQLVGGTGLNVAWHAKLLEEIREGSGVTAEDAVKPVDPSIS